MSIAKKRWLVALPLLVGLSLAVAVLLLRDRSFPETPRPHQSSPGLNSEPTVTRNVDVPPKQPREWDSLTTEELLDRLRNAIRQKEMELANRLEKEVLRRGPGGLKVVYKRIKDQGKELQDLEPKFISVLEHLFDMLIRVEHLPLIRDELLAFLKLPDEAFQPSGGVHGIWTTSFQERLVSLLAEGLLYVAKQGHTAKVGALLTEVLLSPGSKAARKAILRILPRLQSPYLDVALILRQVFKSSDDDDIRSLCALMLAGLKDPSLLPTVLESAAHTMRTLNIENTTAAAAYLSTMIQLVGFRDALWAALQWLEDAQPGMITTLLDLVAKDRMKNPEDLEMACMLLSMTTSAKQTAALLALVNYGPPDDPRILAHATRTFDQATAPLARAQALKIIRGRATQDEFLRAFDVAQGSEDEYLRKTGIGEAVNYFNRRPEASNVLARLKELAATGSVKQQCEVIAYLGTAKMVSPKNAAVYEGILNEILKNTPSSEVKATAEKALGLSPKPEEK